MKKIKALVLFSGGLDSMLAACVLREQGIEVTALCFESNFYNANKAKQAAEQLGLGLRVYDISPDMIGLVKNPPHGHGKNLNPCIDCHSLMIKIAGQIAREEEYDLVATGEVLGQRPFSQNIRSLAKVAEVSGVDVLRPLSARLLPETESEKSGLVKRSMLLDLSGRGRERQFALVRKYGIKEFASPSGGCMLTDPDFSERLRKMLKFWPDCNHQDIELLKHGRVAWFEDQEGHHHLLVTGRHQEDNANVSKLFQSGDMMIALAEINGPTALLRSRLPLGNEAVPSRLDIPELATELLSKQNRSLAEIVITATKLTGYYAPRARGQNMAFDVRVID